MKLVGRLCVTSLRRLWKEKLHTAIDVIGLAAGLAACLISALVFYDASSYDQFHEKADQIYRVVRVDTVEGNATALMPPNLVTLKERIPEIEEVVRFDRISDISLAYLNHKFQDERLIFADPSIFRIFSFKLIREDAQGALTQPSTIVLTERAARRYFGDANPIGKVITLADQVPLEVTGIVEDIPRRSTIQFDGLISFGTLYKVGGLADAEETVRKGTGWVDRFHTYVLLQPEASKDIVAGKIKAFAESLSNVEVVSRSAFRLSPLTDTYLHGGSTERLGPSGNAGYMYIFISVATLLLLLACINHASLFTVRSAVRNREVGVRKALGAHSFQLTQQFLTESVLVSIIAFLIALLLARTTLPVVESFLGHSLSAFSLLHIPFILGGVIAAVFVGVVSGAYPAYRLARLHTVTALKGKRNQAVRNFSLRNALFVTQLAAAATLLALVFVVHRQVQFMQNESLGFDAENVVVLNSPLETGQAQALQAHIATESAVNRVVVARGLPTRPSSTVGFHIEGQAIKANKWDVGPGFFEALDLHIVRGDPASSADRMNETLVVNKAFLQEIGWTEENAVGKQIGDRSIVGIVSNFHYESLQKPIAPLMLQLKPTNLWQPHSMLIVDLVPGASSAFTERLEAIWKSMVPDAPLEYFFLSNAIDANYRSEQRLADLLTAFLVLSFVVVCMGMFALSAYLSERKAKEVAIRKVFGASTVKVTFLMLSEFGRSTLLAVFVACPIAYFVADKWLQSFAYRIPLSASLFVAAAGVTIMVTLAAVLYHVLRASMANPVKSLRQEA